jgi:hypothetical protein
MIALILCGITLSGYATSGMLEQIKHSTLVERSRVTVAVRPRLSFEACTDDCNGHPLDEV